MATLFLGLFMATSTRAADPKRASNQASEGRAVSLKVLQERVKECMATGKCPENILKLCGLNKVTGFVIDEKNRDLILLGKVDAISPSLYLEDFVIALRNAWWKYAPLKGNTYYYSAPGCSIDPNPETIQRLQHAGSGILSASGEMEESLQEWHSICQKPQKVRVMGIPFHNRFAKIMVDADYYMKRLVDGSVSLRIDGLTSLTDITLSIVRRNIEEAEPVSIPLQSMNRFWFFPGENRFIEDRGILLIEKVPVILLTEEEFLTQGGRVAGSGRPDSLAQRFTDIFTARFDQIAKVKSIYAELEGLFRFVALAKVMKFKKALSEARLAFDYLLRRYPIGYTLVSTSLPGISNVKQFQHKTEVTGGYSIAYVWLPSCGGVSIDVMIREKNIAKDTIGRLEKLRRIVLSARPSPDATFWDFPLRRSVDLDAALGSRLKETKAMKDVFRNRIIIDLHIRVKDMAPLI